MGSRSLLDIFSCTLLALSFFRMKAILSHFWTCHILFTWLLGGKEGEEVARLGLESGRSDTALCSP